MTKKIFIFSSDKKDLISVMDYSEEFETNLSTSTVPYKVLNIDETHQYWYGNYDTGSLRSKDVAPLIEESVIETIVNKEILVKYPIHSQLNIMADCMEKAGIPLTPEFIAMRSFIKQKVTNYNNSIEVYSENTDIYSWIPKPTLPTE
jgi:hypothetical protein